MLNTDGLFHCDPSLPSPPYSNPPGSLHPFKPSAAVLKLMLLQVPNSFSWLCNWPHNVLGLPTQINWSLILFSIWHLLHLERGMSFWTGFSLTICSYQIRLTSPILSCYKLFIFCQTLAIRCLKTYWLGPLSLCTILLQLLINVTL